MTVCGRRRATRLFLVPIGAVWSAGSLDVESCGRLGFVNHFSGGAAAGGVGGAGGIIAASFAFHSAALAGSPVAS